MIIDLNNSDLVYISIIENASNESYEHNVTDKYRYIIIIVDCRRPLLLEDCQHLIAIELQPDSVILILNFSYFPFLSVSATCLPAYN